MLCAENQDGAFATSAGYTPPLKRARTSNTERVTLYVPIDRPVPTVRGITDQKTTERTEPGMPLENHSHIETIEETGGTLLVNVAWPTPESRARDASTNYERLRPALRDVVRMRTPDAELDGDVEVWGDDDLVGSPVHILVTPEEKVVLPFLPQTIDEAPD